MAQEQGFFGTVKNYIPGMAGQEPHGTNAENDQDFSANETAGGQQQGSQGGILSYIPGFGGNSSAENTGTDGGDAARTTRSGTVYGKDNNDNTGYDGSKGLGGAVTSTTGDINNTTTRGSGNQEPQYGNERYSQRDQEPRSDYSGNQQQGRADKGSTGGGYGTGNQQGYQGQAPDTDYNRRGNAATEYNPRTAATAGQYGDGQQNSAPDSEVKGAPIEGENVKGYAVSAPVGTGDVNTRSEAGDPSGQVSGAHMQYGPVATDDRDQGGRGTFGSTTGEGDSSFANVKRNIDHGTEHVTSHQSTSRVSHTSTTQL